MGVEWPATGRSPGAGGPQARGLGRRVKSGLAFRNMLRAVRRNEAHIKVVTGQIEDLL